MCGLFATYSLPVATDPDDSRRRGQEQDLPPGTVFLRRDNRALDERWEHDHREMCWAKFMDPRFSADHAQFIGEHPDVLTMGLVTLAWWRRPRPGLRGDRSMSGLRNGARARRAPGMRCSGA